MNKIKIEIEVSDEQIDNWLCGAFEGGSNYWCIGLEVKNNDYKGTEFASDCISKGGVVIVNNGSIKNFHIDKKKVLTSLKTMNSKHPQSFNRLIDDSYDSEDSDTLFQIACFGEVVYG